MREGVQYYHRYLAAFHLQRYDLVARDTERNLRLFAFVVRHAARQRDKLQFDQYRPYVTMMHTRALALAGAGPQDDHAAALALIDEGIEGIRALPPRLRPGGARGRMLRARLPAPLASRGRARTADRAGRAARAAARRWPSRSEDYEEAARIRDQLRGSRGDAGDLDPRAGS